MRFGIGHIDYETEKRTVKKSARLYAGIVASNVNILNES